MLSRIIYLVIILFLLYISILTFQFLLFRLAFPDPTIIYLREGLGPEEREIIRRSFGLDRPLYEQYILYISNFLRGDMGISFLYKAPVRDIVVDRLLNTAILVFPSLATAYTLAWILGSHMAWRRGSIFERLGVSIMTLTQSLPLFWIGLVALILLSVEFRIFPPGGMRTPPYEATNFIEKIFSLDFLHHWILPYIVLTIYTMSSPTLLMRASMISTLGEDFIITLRAMGHPQRKIVRDASRYSILPLITQLGIAVGLSFAGSVAFETVFSWPGIGRELVIAFNNLDYPLAQGIFAIMSLAIIVSNTVADILYSILDPRIRR
jgi:peptide/nickel transport system permease protein